MNPVAPHTAPRPEAVEHWRNRIVRTAVRLKDAFSVEPLTRERVLEARRAAKKLRAFATMAEIEPGLSRKTIATANALRRALGAQRKDDVAASLLNVDASPQAQEPDATPVLDDARLNERLKKLNALRKRWRHADIGRVDEAALFESLRKTYRRARRRAVQDGSSAASHRWRRTVVDLEYQARLLTPYAPALADVATAADALRRALGDARDADEVVSLWRSRGMSVTAEASTQLAKRQAAAHEDALAISRSLFAEKSRDWLRRIRSDAEAHDAENDVAG